GDDSKPGRGAAERACDCNSLAVNQGDFSTRDSRRGFSKRAALDTNRYGRPSARERGLVSSLSRFQSDRGAGRHEPDF
ncbi:MAG: hypothetical protein WAO00_16485, partial [Chthoniobacterales bacterium]